MERIDRFAGIAINRTPELLATLTAGTAEYHDVLHCGPKQRPRVVCGRNNMAASRLRIYTSMCYRAADRSDPIMWIQE